MRGDMNRAPMWRGRVRNMIHPAVLITGMLALLAALGGFFGGTVLMVVLVGFGVAFVALEPSLGSRVLLRMQGAVPLSPHQTPRLTQVVVGLARRTGLPAVPQLDLVPKRAVTAHTTGTRESAAIAVTRRLVRALDLREMAGVLAQEVSHIRSNPLRTGGASGDPSGSRDIAAE